MADYYSVIARAVSRLPSKTDEARHAIYERARTALRETLLEFDPPLSETVLANEQAVLDAAICTVEVVNDIRRGTGEEARFVVSWPQRHERLTSNNTATISRHDFCSLCRQSWHCWAARSCLTANRSNQPQPHLREVEKPGPAAMIRSAARDLRATSGVQSVTRRNFTGRHSRLPFATRQPNKSEGNL
jgi:hypothetical protein